jgi:hypothetical protein
MASLPIGSCLPSDKPGQSRLLITGREVSTLLDQVDVVQSYPGCPDSVIATDDPGALRRQRSGSCGLSDHGYSFSYGADSAAARDGSEVLAAPGCRQRLCLLCRATGIWQKPGLLWSDTRMSVPLTPLRIDMGTQSNVDSLVMRQDGAAPRLSKVAHSLQVVRSRFLSWVYRCPRSRRWLQCLPFRSGGDLTRADCAQRASCAGCSYRAAVACFR